MHCKPFDIYIAECAEWIKQRRANFPIETIGINHHTIITANSPYDLKPVAIKENNTKHRYGALLIHGLFDCPFSLREIGTELQQAGIHTRSILLPGHGTHPTDLLTVTHHDWLNTLNYGIKSFIDSVDHLFLIGYSTGGALAVYHSLHHYNVSGVVLLAPALKIKAPIQAITRWPSIGNCFLKMNPWLCRGKELDYTKYRSIPFNPIFELQYLINKINQSDHRLKCPMMVIMSEDDETVSTTATMHVFNKQTFSKNKFLLYTKNNYKIAPHKVEIRRAAYPEFSISHISHIALPFSQSNVHYGQYGDYYGHHEFSLAEADYGAYNRVEKKLFNQLYKFKFVKKPREILTFNPDFDHMIKSIIKWITI